ncbi:MULTISPECIES: homoserine kinase [Vagococcus]|uniref:Homoserine kinase n=1 Tax=Vagococcus fluvialis bH819 TaxID=1255619 RepID=A0A1X6WR93_9ENTE|nr:MULTISPECIES: homoserine kinase [Vagococcus]SLM86797.1 Homoserine kinase [Vagococcus fluvialis bH819]HCM88744.1 homoserine kinase [Vagococcus sp.]
MRIIVPATTANLGPGFDSFGLALSMYLELEIVGKSTQWIIEHNLENLATDENNLIIKTALEVCPELDPHKVKMTTDIPLARGLGSSSSAIVAGIELANQLGRLALTKEEKLRIASKIEGHPDNVAPAILGSFVVASQLEDGIYYTRHDFPKCGMIAVIPDYQLLTKVSRNVLPDRLTYEYAVEASSISNVVLSSLITGDLKQAGLLMEQDKWHEPFRNALVPELNQVRALKKSLNIYTAVLSGAGPTVLVLCPLEDKEKIAIILQEKLNDSLVKTLEVDELGVRML